MSKAGDISFDPGKHQFREREHIGSSADFPLSPRPNQLRESDENTDAFDLLIHNSIESIAKRVESERARSDHIETRMDVLERHISREVINPEERIYVHNNSFEEAVTASIDDGGVLDQATTASWFTDQLERNMTYIESIVEKSSKRSLDKIYRSVSVTGAIMSAIALLITLIVGSHILSVILIFAILYFAYVSYTGLYDEF